MDEIRSNKDPSFGKLIMIAANYILIKKTIMTSILKHILTKQEKKNFLQKLTDSERMNLYCKSKKKRSHKIKTQTLNSLEQKKSSYSDTDTTNEELEDNEQSKSCATSPESTFEKTAMVPNKTLTQYFIIEDMLWDLSSDSSNDDESKYQLSSDSDDDIEKAKGLIHPEVTPEPSSSLGLNPLSLFKSVNSFSSDTSKLDEVDTKDLGGMHKK